MYMRIYLLGVLVIRALLLGVYNRALAFLEAPRWNKGGYEISQHLKTLKAGQSWTSDDGEVMLGCYYGTYS